MAGAQAVALWEAPKHTHPPPSPACTGRKAETDRWSRPGRGALQELPTAGHTVVLKAGVRPGTAVQGSGAEMTVFWGAPATPPQPPPWNRPQTVPCWLALPPCTVIVWRCPPQLTLLILPRASEPLPDL